MLSPLFKVRAATAAVILACLTGLGLIGYLGPGDGTGPSAYGYNGVQVATIEGDA